MVKKIRTGRDEYDEIQRAREAAREAYRLARNSAVSWVKSSSSPEEAMKRIDKVMSWEEKYVNPIKQTRSRLGAAAGSSKTKGSIETKISPSIVRYRETGNRAAMPKSIGPEYVQESRGTTPKQQSSSYLSIANARIEAKSAGKSLAVDLRGLSQQVKKAGESASRRFGMDIKKYYDAAGPAIRGRERVGTGLSRAPRGRTVNLPVNPSVPVKRAPTGSKFEPIKGSNTVPKAFKDAFKGFGLGGVAGFGGIGSGIDDLWLMNRGEGGGGAGGDYKTTRKKK